MNNTSCYAPVIVLTRVELTGRRQTDRMGMRDCNWFPDWETEPVASALVYSRSLDELPAAREFADRNGYACTVMDDTEDVLPRAREGALAAYLSACRD